MPTQNINWLQLSIKLKNTEDIHKTSGIDTLYTNGQLDSLLQVKSFFDTCTSLSVQMKDLDIETEDDDEEFTDYLITYKFND